VRQFLFASGASLQKLSASEGRVSGPSRRQMTVSV